MLLKMFDIDWLLDTEVYIMKQKDELKQIT